MKVYRIRPLLVNPFPLMGIFLMIFSVVFCYFTATRTENTVLVVIFIILSGLMFYGGMFAMGMGKSVSTGDRQDAFAVTDDEKIVYIHANMASAASPGQTNIGKGVSVVKNAQIIEYNENLIKMMDSEGLEDYVENCLEYGAFPASPYHGRISCAVMENPVIKNKSITGCEVWFTTGEHQKIHCAELNERNEGYKYIKNIIKNTPCKVNYEGKNIGDYFID